VIIHCSEEELVQLSSGRTVTHDEPVPAHLVEVDVLVEDDVDPDEEPEESCACHRDATSWMMTIAQKPTHPMMMHPHIRVISSLLAFMILS
jgi:hypothetical protein